MKKIFRYFSFLFIILGVISLILPFGWMIYQEKEKKEDINWYSRMKTNDGFNYSGLLMPLQVESRRTDTSTKDYSVVVPYAYGEKFSVGSIDTIAHKDVVERLIELSNRKTGETLDQYQIDLDNDSKSVRDFLGVKRKKNTAKMSYSVHGTASPDARKYGLMASLQPGSFEAENEVLARSRAQTTAALLSKKTGVYPTKISWEELQFETAQQAEEAFNNPKILEVMRYARMDVKLDISQTHIQTYTSPWLLFLWLSLASWLLSLAKKPVLTTPNSNWRIPNFTTPGFITALRKSKTGIKRRRRSFKEKSGYVVLFIIITAILWSIMWYIYKNTFMATIATIFALTMIGITYFVQALDDRDMLPKLFWLKKGWRILTRFIKKILRACFITAPMFFINPIKKILEFAYQRGIRLLNKIGIYRNDRRIIRNLILGPLIIFGIYYCLDQYFFRRSLLAMLLTGMVVVFSALIYGLATTNLYHSPEINFSLDWLVKSMRWIKRILRACFITAPLVLLNPTRKFIAQRWNRFIILWKHLIPF